jgi:four helix bundle protein
VGTDGRGAPASRFEELEVWQTARELAKGIYRAARTQKLAREPVLRNQMMRAVVSVSSNIAEGYERGTRKQHIEFCYLAKGSAGELRTQLILARDSELPTEKAFAWLLDRCDKCSRQLAKYVQHLQRTQQRIPGTKFKQSSRGAGSTPTKEQA